MNKKTVLVLLSTIMLSSCSFWQSDNNTNQQPTRYFANEEDVISLQNLETRVIVHCKTTQTELAENCAQAFEKQGFVRFREIPFKTADHDFIKKDTYPTRRWRTGERTPRW